ncbi:MAG: PP2C family protein-serine/threonine phosphatase, partial [Mycobacteriales bacterium]
EIPQLPPGWKVEVSLRSAGGAAFAGDFVSSSVTNCSGVHSLELSLVDVSGKGVEAGTRALLLSGALGGLLGAVSPEAFLVEANRYLIRQDWTEGFATAVHVTLNLNSGEYALESAGHPPAVHFEAGSGHWRVSAVEGPLLGVLPEVTYAQGRGMLGPGDALLIYTDGLVEVPGRDIDVGLDRLLGAAERLVLRGGFGGGADRLINEVAAEALDDRALVLVWRT